MQALQDTGPTTLITPQSLEALSSDSSGFSPILFVVGSLLIVVVSFVFVHRRRRGDPSELAFKALAYKAGLSRTQINRIRKHALSMGLSSPIGIILSPELTAQALND